MALLQDCITSQHQMNLVRNVMNRISNMQTEVPTITDLNVLLASACTDKLRHLTEALLDLLLYIINEQGSQVSDIKIHYFVNTRILFATL